MNELYDIYVLRIYRIYYCAPLGMIPNHHYSFGWFCGVRSVSLLKRHVVLFATPARVVKHQSRVNVALFLFYGQISVPSLAAPLSCFLYALLFAEP